MGGTTNWQPHLNALTAVLNGLTPEVADTQGGVEHARRFLIANLLWFDLLACASTGTSPKSAYREWLNGGIDMRPIMGCQNWAMIAIGDVATLNTRRLFWDEIPDEVSEVKNRIDEGLQMLSGVCVALAWVISANFVGIHIRHVDTHICDCSSGRTTCHGSSRDIFVLENL